MVAATIISGILALTGTVAAAGISAGAAGKAQRKQEIAWREQMQIEEEQKRKDNIARSLKMFEDTINRSTVYKHQTAALWAGRG